VGRQKSKAIYRIFIKDGRRIRAFSRSLKAPEPAIKLMGRV
jgi:hypothetical protein